MGRKTVTFPFEASFEDIQASPDVYVDSVFACLGSEFMVMPKGPGFIEYPVFERGYEALKCATGDFADWAPERLLQAICDVPISFVVLRSIMGFTPPEWAYVTTQRTGVSVTQGAARTLDRKIRMAPSTKLKPTKLVRARLEALVGTACALVGEGAATGDEGLIHRLDKADTRGGSEGVQNLSHLGAPYAMLLYERFLGRPFAGHRDSVSELMGNTLEGAIEDVLSGAGVGFRKTRRAETISGFDQTPDFIIPDEYNPQVIIEAKIAEDDGTARDKVTRIQHLAELSTAGQPSDSPKYEVVACVAGRGFGVRREDMKKMLYATRGKVFTFKTLAGIVEHTRLHEFRTR